MDIDALHSALISLTLVSEEIQAARAELGHESGERRTALRHLLAGMERDLRVAKAALAAEVGIELCHCCWPPEMMVTDLGGKSHCAGGLRPRVTLPRSRAKNVSAVTRPKRWNVSSWPKAA